MTSTSNVVDVSAWVGSYPFRGIPDSGLGNLQNLSRDLTIRKVIVSSFENLFWENGFDGYKTQQAKLESLDFVEHWPVVNPAMPGQIAALESLVERYRPRGLRLLPNYHSYNLGNSAVTEVMCFARERRMIVQVFQCIADSRWHWMLHVPDVEEEQIQAFVDEYNEQPVVICAMRNPAVLADRLESNPLLYVDTSRIRGPVFAFEHLIETVPASKILFGSLWPIQIIQATLWQIQYGALPEAIRNSILRENYQLLCNSSVTG